MIQSNEICRAVQPLGQTNFNHFLKKKKISLTSKEETTAMFKHVLKVEPETAACVYFVRECHQDARVRQGK